MGFNKSEISQICIIITWMVVYLTAKIELEIIIYSIAPLQNACIERLIEDKDHVPQVSSLKAEVKSKS